jgi:hypothetical protein
MRGPIGMFLVAAAVAACGSSNAGSGDRSPSQATLRLTTSGNGLVRGAGADCRGNCSAQYVSGSQVHLVAVPDTGAVFVGWAGACSGTGGCDLTLDADRDVSATFAVATPPPQGQHRLTVVVQGKGRVTSSPTGIDCESSSCSADFASGTAVTLTPAPASGYGFAGWGTDCSGAGGCTLSVAKEATVYANFVAQTPPPPVLVHLTATVTGPGTVTGAGLDCGESTKKCDVTVQGGSAVTLTASAGGGTRFTGWGGACGGASSTCTLTLQSDTNVTAEFQSEVLALAPNDGTNGSVIVLNSTHLFWSRYTSAGSAIWAIPKKGGDAVRVATGYANAMVADDAYLYWTDGPNLYSTPVGGGQVALLFTGYSLGKLALDEVGALYWTMGTSGTNTGSVHRMQDRADTVLAKGQNPLGAVAVDASHVYFTDFDSNGGAIRRVPRAGGAVEGVFYCGLKCVPQAVRLDAQNVYFRLGYYGNPSSNGHVQVMSKADFKVRVLSSDNGNGGNGGYFYGMEVEVNASVAYWNWTAGTSPYGIFRANADGAGFHAVDTSNDVSWLGLRVDDVAMYYWRYGAVIRRLK